MTKESVRGTISRRLGRMGRVVGNTALAGLESIQNNQGPEVASNIIFANFSGPNRGRVEREKIVPISANPVEIHRQEPQPDNLVFGNFPKSENDRTEREKIVPTSALVELVIPEVQPSNLIELQTKPEGAEIQSPIDQVEKEAVYNPGKRANEYTKSKKDKLLIVRRSGCRCPDPEDKSTSPCRSRFCGKKQMVSPVSVKKPRRMRVKGNTRVMARTPRTKEAADKSKN